MTKDLTFYVQTLN